jgi:hypothetical protein
MTVQFPSERCKKVLNILSIARKRIYKKKLTPAGTLAKLIGNAFCHQNPIPQNIFLF